MITQNFYVFRTGVGLLDFNFVLTYRNCQSRYIGIFLEKYVPVTVDVSVCFVHEVVGVGFGIDFVSNGD